VKEAAGGDPAAFAQLIRAAEGLSFELHNIRRFLDERGRYDVELSREFPLLIKLFRFTAREFTAGPTWHERLELFIPLDGECRFRMGEKVLTLQPGDVLVVDTMQVHNMVDEAGLDTRVIVISFLPDLVYSLGSPSHDYAFLVPFYARPEAQPHLLARADPETPAVYQALTALLDTYFHQGERPYFRAGCKAFLLEILYHLACRFRSTEVDRSEFQRQQELTQRFHKLFQHVGEHYAGKINVAQAARICGLSASQFMKQFKQVSSTTFVDYVTHVRLSKAHQLLRETNFTIAEIASLVGFADQSYFDRRFKEYFNQTPRDFRRSRVC
jgi:AraC-like DNA-binding protein/mannose-6-phosphate isomerase-like protein (cupin superfamily)